MLGPMSTERYRAVYPISHYVSLTCIPFDYPVSCITDIRAAQDDSRQTYQSVDASGATWHTIPWQRIAIANR